MALLDVIIALGYYRHRKLIPAGSWFERDRLRIRTVGPCWKRLAIIKRNLKLKVTSVEQDEDAVIVIGAGRWESLGERYRIRLKPGTEGMAALRARLGDMKQAQWLLSIVRSPTRAIAADLTGRLWMGCWRP